MVYKYLKISTLFVLFLYFLVNILYIFQQDIWHRVDEVAHLDYIAQLSSQRLPYPREDISPEVASSLLSSKFMWLKPKEFKGTLNTAGILNKSYEMHQPPVYYALFSIPYSLLKNVGWSLEERIDFLRGLNGWLFFLAALCCIPIFKQLNRLNPQIPQDFGYFFAFMILIISLSDRYHISNDQLSLLLGQISLYFSLRFYHLKQFRDYLITIIFTILMIFTKYTNAYYFVFLGILTYVGTKNINKKPFYLSYFMAILFIILGLYAFDALNRIKITQAYFQTWVLPLESIHDFFYIFFKTWLNFDHFYFIKLLEFHYYFYFSALLLIINFIVLMRRLKYQSNEWLVLISFLIVTLILSSALCLNYVSVGTHWFSFRLYNAYLLFFLVALFYEPLLRCYQHPKIGKKIIYLPIFAFFPFYLYALF